MKFDSSAKTLLAQKKTSPTKVATTSFNPATGFIEIDSQGELNVEQTKALFDTFDREIADVRKAGKPVLLLVRLAKLGPSNAEARRLSGKRAREVDFDRAAVVASDSFSLALTKLITHAAGMHERLRFFDREQEARTWLARKA